MSDLLKAFENELESQNFKGYWQNVQGDVKREPVASFEPCLWKGKDLFAAMEKAGDVVGVRVRQQHGLEEPDPGGLERGSDDLDVPQRILGLAHQVGAGGQCEASLGADR